MKEKDQSKHPDPDHSQGKPPVTDDAEPADDPFRTFSEWNSDADRHACEHMAK